MRTTINLDSEAEEAVAAVRRAEGLGVSDAVNLLIRRGANRPRVEYVFPSMDFEMGARIPIDKTSELLEILDEAEGQ